MALGARCEVHPESSEVPFLRQARILATQGFVTGASNRNWDACRSAIVLPTGFAAADQVLLTDPQTSGGLLVACAPSALEEVLAILRRHGFTQSAVIGAVAEAPAAPRLVVA